MEVAPFFVDFRHFWSIFTIFYRVSRFTHFCHNLHFDAIYALFPQIFLVKIAFPATSHVFCMYGFNPILRGKFLCLLAFSNISGQLWTCIFMGPSQFRPSCCDSGTMYLQWTPLEIHLWKQAQENYLLFVSMMINTFWNVKHCLCYIRPYSVSASAETRYAMSGGPSHDFDSPCQSWIFFCQPWRV